MKPITTLQIELIIILATVLVCSLLFLSTKENSDFDILSWRTISTKLLLIQEQCRDARGLRKTNDSIELIASNGDLLILTIEDQDSEQTLKFERRNLTRIKDVTTIKNLSNISIDFKKLANGLPDQDLTLKALYKDASINRSIAIFIDLSLSNPRLIQELKL